jgi:EAL domain-containing protein (putative c-di-GMP-specific phosphodiesterase class I)/FixJ family two-component response regulator
VPATTPPPAEPRLHQVGIVIAEDDAPMRSALAALLSAEPGLEVLGVAADAAQAIDLATLHRPDVCLADVSMPAGGGPYAARVIRERCPETKVLALSGRGDRASVVEMLRAGAIGYLVKGADPRRLVEAVRDAARGRRPLSPVAAASVADALSEHLAEQDAAARRRKHRHARLDRLLAEGLIDVALQPIIDLRDGRTVAFEALARFALEPTRTPPAWLADAAELGRLTELDVAAARAALAHLPRLPAGTQLTLNLLPATAGSEDFARLLPTGRACERIVVEITEHTPIDDYEAFAPNLERLRRRGVRIAIDDAGAGFASLRHILRLSPDIIKADMTLTRRIETDRAERALTRALISFAAEIGATVVAEGIESEAEVTALRELGVAYGQGYHLGRPAVPSTIDHHSVGSRRPRAGAARAPSSAVRCLNCDFAWQSQAMARGLALLGACPRCDGELAFADPSLGDAGEPRPVPEHPPHLVLGLPRRWRER